MSKEIGTLIVEYGNAGWKELDINNIPSDFFVNERYEILNKFQSEVENVKFIDKINILKNLNEYESLGVTYRLKPLEPIRVPEEIYDILNHLSNQPVCSFGTIHNKEVLTHINNRPVEIIKEN